VPHALARRVLVHRVLELALPALQLLVQAQVPAPNAAQPAVFPKAAAMAIATVTSGNRYRA